MTGTTCALRSTSCSRGSAGLRNLADGRLPGTFHLAHRAYALDVVSAALARPDPVRAKVRTKALCCVGASLAETLGWGSEAATKRLKK